MDITHPFDVHPWEDVPVAMSLLQFNNTFINLDSQRGNDERAQAKAQKHTLTLGLTSLNLPAHRRIIIEPLRNHLHWPYVLDISRDYDSLIAFTDELPVSQDLYIYCVFHLTMTLTKSVHVHVCMCTQARQVTLKIKLYQKFSRMMNHMSIVKDILVLLNGSTIFRVSIV